MKTVKLVGGPYDGKLQAIPEGNKLVVMRFTGPSVFGPRVKQRGEYRASSERTPLVWVFQGWFDMPEPEIEQP